MRSSSIKDILGSIASLHRQGLLLPVLRREAERAALLSAARELGLSVSTDELQAAADHVRRKKGFTSAADTERWLMERQLTILEWEDSLEEELLLAKLKAHVTSDAVATAFAADPKAYDQIRLRKLLVDSMDLANELLNQIREGADFVRLAVDYSRDSVGGRAVTAFRCDFGELAVPLFAATPGSVVGPVSTAAGVQLFLVEGTHSATDNAITAATIRERAFTTWIAERTRDLPTTFPLLDAIR